MYNTYSVKALNSDYLLDALASLRAMIEIN